MNRFINGGILNLRYLRILDLIAADAFHSQPNHFQKNRKPIYYASTNETLQLYQDASRYYNKSIDVTTFGQHKKWRKNLVDNLGLSNNSKVLDSAGGTGLTTSAFLDFAKKSNLNLRVTLCDMNSQMMSIGQQNLETSNYDPKSVNWVECNVNALPFDKETFDAFVITFGLRTGVDINLLLQEAFRVLKPGGKIGIVDYCYSDKPTMVQWLHHKHIKYVCGMVHQVLWKAGLAMLYLAENVKLCPSKEKLTATLQDAGFVQITSESYFFGAVIQYLGQKPNKM